MNKMKWRLTIAVQVMAFFIAAQTFVGVGIKIMATDIKLKVMRNK